MAHGNYVFIAVECGSTFCMKFNIPYVMWAQTLTTFSLGHSHVHLSYNSKNATFLKNNVCVLKLLDSS